MEDGEIEVRISVGDPHQCSNNPDNLRNQIRIPGEDQWHCEVNDRLPLFRHGLKGEIGVGGGWVVGERRRREETATSGVGNFEGVGASGGPGVTVEVVREGPSVGVLFDLGCVLQGLASVGFAGAAGLYHIVELLMVRVEGYDEGVPTTRVLRGKSVMYGLENMDCGAVQAVGRVVGAAGASAEERYKGQLNSEAQQGGYKSNIPIICGYVGNGQPYFVFIVDKHRECANNKVLRADEVQLRLMQIQHMGSFTSSSSSNTNENSPESQVLPHPKMSSTPVYPRDIRILRSTTNEKPIAALKSARKGGKGDDKTEVNTHKEESYCNEIGHWYRECEKRIADEEKGRKMSDYSASAYKCDISAFFSEKTDEDKSVWLADTGASLHMTFRAIFSVNSDRLVRGRSDALSAKGVRHGSLFRMLFEVQVSSKCNVAEVNSLKLWYERLCYINVELDFDLQGHSDLEAAVELISVVQQQSYERVEPQLEEIQLASVAFNRRVMFASVFVFSKVIN
uniref:(California timema) hypothetical protein n=1 Tax=Timema californicum TaxID=61474 RepID=A0A7R9IYP0_TIMCA|nr:unnamed protein product [Timema californicum]